MPRTIRGLAALLLIPGGLIARAADPVFPSPTQAETWKMLPRKNPALPAWARTLAPALPHGVAKMVELDDFHRTASPVGPILRAKLRWVAADVNGSEYGKEYAAADLEQLGGSVESLKNPEKLPAAERAALAFARKLSAAAHSITDEEVAELVTHYGYKTVVGIVHTVAYANFQDRVLIGLRTKVEPAGPLPPVGVQFDLAQIAAPEKPTAAPAKPAADADADADDKPATKKPAAGIKWQDDAPDLAAGLDAQKNRKPRIPPVEQQALAGIPDQRLREQARQVIWSNLSMGYQPQLTGAWFASMSAAQQDTKFERTFSNSVFWIVTRSNQCFY